MASISVSPSDHAATDWRQVGIAALAQNVATGLAFGSFGTLVLGIEREYGADRAQSSLALALMVATLSASAAIIGRMLERRSIRRLMMTGAVVGAVGYGLLAVTSGTTGLLAIYALLLGPAAAMLGVLPSSTLATRWVPEERRGRALGLVNMPILVMLVPLAIGWVLQHGGVRTAFAMLAVAQIAVLPALLLVRDGTAPAVDAEVSKRAQAIDRTEPGIVARPAFWLVTLSIGLLAGAGTMKLAHLVPLLTQQGRTFEQANLLLALSAGTGLIGSLAFGWLADRIGAASALFINAVLQAASWTIFLTAAGMPLLVLDAVVVGACGGGVQSALGVLIATLFGARSFGRAFGLVSLSTLPFLFGLTPLAGLLYQRSGSYHLPMAAMIGGLLVAAALLGLLIRPERRRRVAPLSSR